MGTPIGISIGQTEHPKHPALSPCGEVLAGHTTLSREEGIRHGWDGADKSPRSNEPAMVRSYHDGYAIGKAARSKRDRT